MLPRKILENIYLTIKYKAFLRHFIKHNKLWGWMVRICSIFKTHKIEGGGGMRGSYELGRREI